MAFEIEGTLHKVFDMESKSASFQTREFVITTEGTYPQFVKFQLTQDKCSLVDGYNSGDRIKVYFDLRGREWQDKFFTNLNAWRLEKAGTLSDTLPSNMQTPPSFETQASPFDSPSVDGGLPNDFDDLPF